MMAPNFLELFIIEPKEGTKFNSPEVARDFQWILDECASGRGGVTFSFRRSLSDPSQLLFISCWASKEDHDDLDIQGITPKLLKTLMSRITMPPIAVYYLLIEDEERAKMRFGAEVLEVTAWYVREDGKAEFQKVVERLGRKGAWYVEKGIPPRPAIMPADETEVRMIEEGEKRAKARLERRSPDIWISFMTDEEEKRLNSFDDAVKGYVWKVEGGRYEKFLEGCVVSTG
jgi:hypothetical protein